MYNKEISSVKHSNKTPPKKILNVFTTALSFLSGFRRNQRQNRQVNIFSVRYYISRSSTVTVYKKNVSPFTQHLISDSKLKV